MSAKKPASKPFTLYFSVLTFVLVSLLSPFGALAETGGEGEHPTEEQVVAVLRADEQALYVHVDHYDAAIDALGAEALGDGWYQVIQETAQMLPWSPEIELVTRTILFQANPYREIPRGVVADATAVIYSNAYCQPFNNVTDWTYGACQTAAEAPWNIAPFKSLMVLQGPISRCARTPETSYCIESLELTQVAFYSLDSVCGILVSVQPGYGWTCR